VEGYKKETELHKLTIFSQMIQVEILNVLHQQRHLKVIILIQLVVCKEQLKIKASLLE
jgi:hypothetical protein